MDEEIRAIIDDAYARCTDLLSAHRPQLEAVAQYLLAHETMDGDTFRAVFDEAGRQ